MSPVPSIVMAWPSMVSPSVGRWGRVPPTEDEVSSRDEGAHLGDGRRARGLAASAIRAGCPRLRGTAGRKRCLGALGDVVGRLHIGVLDVDGTCRDIPAR